MMLSFFNNLEEVVKVIWKRLEMGVSRMIRVVIVSMYEKVIERLLWNTAQHEYSTYGDMWIWRLLRETGPYGVGPE